MGKVAAQCACADFPAPWFLRREVHGSLSDGPAAVRGAGEFKCFLNVERAGECHDRTFGHVPRPVVRPEVIARQLRQPLFAADTPATDAVLIEHDLVECLVCNSSRSIPLTPRLLDDYLELSGQFRFIDYRVAE